MPDPSVRARVLDAFAELVETEGLAGATMDAIASRAGVSKTTVYTRWADRSALIVDGFRHTVAKVPEFGPEMEFPEILDMTLGLTADGVSRRRRQMLSELRAAAGVDADIDRVLLENHERWRAVVEDMIERGKRSGHVPADRDVTVAAEVAMAVATERQVMRRKTGKPLRDLVWHLLTDDRPY